MSAYTWGGRKVKRLVLMVLASKGTICHLCTEPGATSADHDPPRSELIQAGVINPDQLCYLWPAHLLCNSTRQARPITPELRTELRTKYLASIGRTPTRPSLSPRFASRRPVFPATPASGRPGPSLYPSGSPQRTGDPP